jgi:O-methyltransferase domain/Dimerisation domain
MSEDPARSVLWMIRGAWITMALRAGVVLGLFDVLGEKLTLEEAAHRTAADAPTLARLLHSFSDLGLVELGDDGRYRNTDLGDCLSQEHPSRLCDLVLMQATLPNLSAWRALDDAVRTGAGVYELVNGRPSWEDLARDPEAQRVFNAAMARRASGQVAAVLAATELTDVDTLVDVGGGKGAMLSGLLQAHPRLRGVLADQPAVAEEAEAAFASAGLADRTRCVPTDFFVSVPEGGDVYTIANVLHDWDDDDATTILRTVRAAMPDHGRLLVVEHVLDAPGRTPEELRDVHLVDLHMLVLFGARERTQAEYDDLLHDAGFTPSRLADPVAHPGSEWNVLEARPAAAD